MPRWTLRTFEAYNKRTDTAKGDLTMRSLYLPLQLTILALLTASMATVAAAEDDQPAPLAIPADSPDLTWGPCPPVFPGGCEIAVLHGDPAQPNADVFLRVPGGYRLPPHTHTSAERMVLAAGELTVKYHGHEAKTLRRGDYAFGPAELPHAAECRSQEPCVLFIAFESAVDAIAYEGELR
jgi:quercetin dioxygenase-like cupin family protein